jgi:hypothetical protein
MPAVTIDRASGSRNKGRAKKPPEISGGFLVTMMPIDERDLS